jgi:hypothetical protein
MTALSSRLKRLETRTGTEWFTFVTTAGRTVRVPAETVLAVFVDGQVPATLANVASTPETAELARGAVRAAVRARQREPGRGRV